MPQVEFAAALQRLVACPAQRVQAATLGQALDAAFAAAPGLKHYVLDEQRTIRKHVAVFVNGRMVPDRARLDLPVGADDRIMVIQALTGG